MPFLQITIRAQKWRNEGRATCFGGKRGVYAPDLFLAYLSNNVHVWATQYENLHCESYS